MPLSNHERLDSLKASHTRARFLRACCETPNHPMNQQPFQSIVELRSLLLFLHLLREAFLSVSFFRGGVKAYVMCVLEFGV